MSGTTGRLIVAVRFDGRERGSAGRSVQYAASTTACEGKRGTVNVLDAPAMNDAAVGVFGCEGEDLDEEIASMCVGKADVLGAFDVGRTDTSIDDARRALGRDVGYVISERAESMELAWPAKCLLMYSMGTSASSGSREAIMSRDTSEKLGRWSVRGSWRLGGTAATWGFMGSVSSGMGRDAT